MKRKSVYLVAKYDLFKVGQEWKDGSEIKVVGWDLHVDFRLGIFVSV